MPDFVDGCQQHQFAHALLVFSASLRGVREDIQVDRLAAVHQGRIRGHAASSVDPFGNGGLRKSRQAAPRESLTRTLGESALRPFAKSLPQLIEIAGHGQHLAIALAQTKIHAQMRIERTLVKIRRRHRRAGAAGKEARQRSRHRVGFGLRIGLEECARKIRRRHVVAAQGFGQRTDHAGRLLLYQTRHQPRHPHQVDGLQQVQWQIHRYTVIVRAGLEAVMQRQPDITQREIFRKAIGFAAFARQQVDQGPFQRLTLFRRQSGGPAVEPLHAVDVGRQAVQVPARLPVLVGNQTGSTQLGFFFAGFFQRGKIARDKGRTRVDLPGDQALANEDVA